MKLKYKVVINVLSLSIVLLLATGHIGSPNIILEGKAGDYNLIVNIMPPEVVPGLAEISVRVEDEGISNVAIQGIYFRNGSEGAPDPENLKQVSGDSQLYAGKIWLMESGSASVKVIVNGFKGRGSTVVPIPALRIREPEMNQKLGLVLTFLGAILFLGLITIIYGSVGEATIAETEKLSSSKKKRALITAGITAVLLVGILWFGNNWWQQEAANYERRMFRKTPVNLKVISADATQKLSIEMEDPFYYDRVPGALVPDHGKLMHLFLMDTTTTHYFAHLHPLKLDSTHYEVVIPGDLPRGDYHVFIDIVHASGLNETIYKEVSIPKQKYDPEIIPAATSHVDPDDSWYHFSDYNSNLQKLSDGIHIQWEQDPDKPIYAGQVQSLTFEVTHEEGIPLPLEPYLTMLGHAAIMQRNASVFIHLHPVGTISMAAQEVLAKRINDDLVTICLPIDSSQTHSTITLNDPRAVTSMKNQIVQSMEENGLQNSVSFPYAFPEAGEFRIWVQMRVLGKIRTAAFDVAVQEAPRS